MIKIKVPPSKSQTIRALVFACFAESESTIINPLISPDVDATILAVKQMGSLVEKIDDCLIVKPNIFKNKDLIINSRNSGLVLRFMTALGALKPCSFQITGDLSIQKRRPIKPLIDAILQLGAKATYLNQYGHPPVKVEGPIVSGLVKMEGSDSQPVSAILTAASFLKGKSVVKVTNPGEKPWVDLTLYWIRKLGGRITHKNHENYTVFGGLNYKGFEYSVPGDFSSAAFPMVAAIITNSHCVIENLFFSDPQGDKRLIDILKKMGAILEVDERNKCLMIHPSEQLSGGVFDVNDIIDAVPILAVLGCFCKSPLKLKNCKIARFKESDRLGAITKELKKMGAKIDSSYDSLTVSPSNLKAAKVKCHSDHRIAMALCVASLKLEGCGFEIDDVECIKKSYPGFLEDLKNFL